MLIDTHCHVDRFPDPPRLAAECERAGVFTVAVTQLPSHYEIAAERLAGMTRVRPALGFHPLAVNGHVGELEGFLAALHEAEFVGEVGLDYSKQGLPFKTDQVVVFRAVAESLSQTPKFTTVHTRKAEADAISILAEFSVTPRRAALVHWGEFNPPNCTPRRALFLGQHCDAEDQGGTRAGRTVARRPSSDGNRRPVREGRPPAGPTDRRSVRTGGTGERVGTSMRLRPSTSSPATSRRSAF